MLHVTQIAPNDRNFLIKYSDGTVSLLTPEELAVRLKGSKTHSLDVDLDISQMEAIAALAASTGQTIDDFIESAIIEKILRDQ